MFEDGAEAVTDHGDVGFNTVNRAIAMDYDSELAKK
jgi:hypothetical protein